MRSRIENRKQKTENRRGRSEVERAARRCKMGRRTHFLLFSVFCFLFSCISLAAPPRDVAASHPASRAVAETVDNRILTLDGKRAFHGAATVTQTEAAIAMARLAQRLEAGAWRRAASVPLPAPALQKTSGDWKRQTVTRYELASVLARLGDYAANGLRRAAKNSADAGKSVVLPPPPKVELPRRHPAYAAVSYLAARRMISADSPLLKPKDAPLTAGVLRTALSQMLIGLTDRLTDLGHDKDGGTPDHSFHK